MNEDRSLSDLASSAAGGDRDAVEALHRRLEPGLRRLFLKRTAGREEIADDLCQRTWAACWRALALGKYDPRRSAFSTYLYAIGSRVWLEHLRQSGRAEPVSELTSYEADLAGEDPAAQARLAEVIHLVRESLAGREGDLPEEDRWILREVGAGATDRDLARRIGVAPSTINARKRQALERLRRLLASRGVRGDSPEQGRGPRQ